MTTPATAKLQDGTLFVAGDWHRDTQHPDAMEFLARNPIEDTPWKINGEALGQWDTALLVFLSRILAEAEKKNLDLQLEGLPEGLRKILDLGTYGRKHAVRQEEKTQHYSFVEQYGLIGLEMRKTLLDVVGFIGDISLSLWHLVTFRSRMRMSDFRHQLDACGPKALGIVTLIGFLMGLILAFVGAIPLKWFHAEPYVASLVGIGMLRLLAPVMVGIVMAGRTSAAYAAELGTMQVNEELDALRTLGIPHTDFLILPRFLAMAVMLPILTIFTDVASILGGMLVAVFNLDLTAHAYFYTLTDTTRIQDLVIGLITCFVLGILDALCGCYQGIHCGRSAASVGRVTTSAVVYSIVCIVIATSVITLITVVLKV